MPIRVTFNGVTYETDTIEEALALGTTAAKEGASGGAHKPTKTRAKRPSISEVFSNGYQPVLKLLLEGPTDSVTIAAALGKRPSSLPPIVRSWKIRARKAGYDNFDELFKIERGTDAKTTLYRLTEEGLKVFRGSHV